MREFVGFYVLNGNKNVFSLVCKNLNFDQNFSKKSENPPTVMVFHLGFIICKLVKMPDLSNILKFLTNLSKTIGYNSESS